MGPWTRYAHVVADTDAVSAHPAEGANARDLSLFYGGGIGEHPAKSRLCNEQDRTVLSARHLRIHLMLPRIELEVGGIHEEIKLLFHRGSFRLREDFRRLELIRFL